MRDPLVQQLEAQHAQFLAKFLVLHYICCSSVWSNIWQQSGSCRNPMLSCSSECHCYTILPVLQWQAQQGALKLRMPEGEFAVVCCL